MASKIFTVSFVGAVIIFLLTGDSVAQSESESTSENIDGKSASQALIVMVKSQVEKLFDLNNCSDETKNGFKDCAKFDATDSGDGDGDGCGIIDKINTCFNNGLKACGDKTSSSSAVSKFNEILKKIGCPVKEGRSAEVKTAKSGRSTATSLWISSGCIVATSLLLLV